MTIKMIRGTYFENFTNSNCKYTAMGNRKGLPLHKPCVGAGFTPCPGLPAKSRVGLIRCELTYLYFARDRLLHSCLSGGRLIIQPMKTILFTAEGQPSKGFKPFEGFVRR